MQTTALLLPCPAPTRLVSGASNPLDASVLDVDAVCDWYSARAEEAPTLDALNVLRDDVEDRLAPVPREATHAIRRLALSGAAGILSEVANRRFGEPVRLFHRRPIRPDAR